MISYPFIWLCLFVCTKGEIMKYIKKEEIVTLLTRLRDAREAKRNCSKQSATEYAIYDYVLKVIDTLETFERD